MKIENVVFEKSISIESEKVSFNERKQVVFIGRSNVGKSSLMNAIFNKKDLVKTSSLPWKTKHANMFLVNNKFHFVDLPGYWFARLGQEHKAKLDALINWYLEEFSPHIKMLFIVIDTKIWPTEVDIDMFKFLAEFSLPITFLSNKIDKLSNNEIAKSINHTENIFFWQRVIPVSAKNWAWIKDVMKVVSDVLAKNKE